MVKRRPNASPTPRGNLEVMGFIVTCDDTAVSSACGCWVQEYEEYRVWPDDDEWMDYE